MTELLIVQPTQNSRTIIAYALCGFALLLTWTVLNWNKVCYIVFNITTHKSVINRSLYMNLEYYWGPQKLPQICTLISYICIGKVAGFEVYICGNIWNA